MVDVRLTEEWYSQLAYEDRGYKQAVQMYPVLRAHGEIV